LTPIEEKILRAASQAGKQTNAVIGSHTLRGPVVLDQLNILEKEGYTTERFIWIHTQAEENFIFHLEAAGRGAWLEYDSLGSDWTPDDYFLEKIPLLMDAGYRDQLLLSHDRGWFDPSQPGGGKPKPFTYLSYEFIPKLVELGLNDETIQMLTHNNPFRAFAR
jgi:phosphotriesterase-related protein